MPDKSVSYRHNIMNINSIDTFLSVKGGFNNNMRDVYLVRAIGECAGYADKVAAADRRMGIEEANKRLRYIRLKKLPPLCGINDTAAYSGIYDELKSSGRLPFKNINASETLLCCIHTALSDTLDKYKENKSAVSDSMARNFATKLLFWTDTVLKDLLEGWSERSCIKILAEDIIKEQEYLFFYFATLIGCDVLLLENKRDTEICSDLKKLSQELRLGEYGNTTLPDYVPYIPDTTAHAKGPERADSPASAHEAGNVRVVIPARNRTRSGVSGGAHNPGNTGAGSSSSGSRNGAKSAGRGAGSVIPAAAGAGSNAQFSQRTIINTAPRGTASGTANAGSEKSFEELAQMASSIVMITVHDNRGNVLGTGSGIMIGSEGYILTNNHVIAKGCFYSVRIEDDDKIYDTDEVIKYNSNLDLAVIRISRYLQPLPIYRGAVKLARGQKVVAIGSPLGLFNSVSDGIISGFREIDNVDMIQFTAPISPGSSGGAVLNMQGEVIGISTAGIDNGQNINLAVGYENILIFAKGFYGSRA